MNQVQQLEQSWATSCHTFLCLETLSQWQTKWWVTHTVCVKTLQITCTVCCSDLAGRFSPMRTRLSCAGGGPQRGLMLWMFITRQAANKPLYGIHKLTFILGLGFNLSSFKSLIFIPARETPLSSCVVWSFTIYYQLCHTWRHVWMFPSAPICWFKSYSGLS